MVCYGISGVVNFATCGRVFLNGEKNLVVRA